jgi:putative CocE/NonD family hydrolase
LISQRKYRARADKIFIPMRDGVKLAAILVHPDEADELETFPALLTYHGYRGTEGDGMQQLGYYAERGYYAAIVDVRGTGSSGGLTPENQYSPQEQEDGLDIIAWLAAQPWCNGNVGMFGTSYSGFNAIQIALLEPPALKAIIPIFATDEVYTDDIPFYDGALQGEAPVRYPFKMIATTGLPASPDYDIDTPEARHRAELEPWVFEMLRHPHDDAFWRRVSLRPNYDALKVPTFLVGGWLDAYTDSVLRMLEHMQAPTRAIMGPWTHGIGIPGPAIDIQQESILWWDRWLKGIDNGVTEGPRLAIYVNEHYRPSLTLQEVPGRWRYEDTWPVERVQQIAWYPQPGGALSEAMRSELKQDLEYKATVGTTNRYRCPHNSAELPIDQRADDAYSMCFDSSVLDRDIEILGNPTAILHVSSTAPVAYWIVRLCDVGPDGTSTLVTKGVLNGTHYESHTAPKALEPGRTYRLEINLKAISWVFARGHRIRVAICNADFPNLWPTPSPMSTSLYVDAEHPSHVLLPLCPAAERSVPEFLPAERQEAPPGELRNQWTITRDEMAGTTTVFRETASSALAWGGPASFERRWLTASDADPARMKIVAEGQAQRKRANDVLTCRSYMTIESDEKSLTIWAKREILLEDSVKYSKEWADVIQRKLI